MITHISSVHMFCEDQNRAKAFYTDRLGFELVIDIPMYPGAELHWISVKPTGAATELALLEIEPEAERFRATIGTTQAFTFGVDDIEGTVAALKARGVVFTQDVDVQPWGTSAVLQDSEGNQVMLYLNPTAR